MIPVLIRPGRGFSIAEVDVHVTTSVALDRGDIVQLVQTAGGVWATCTGAGAGNSDVTGATWTEATKLLTKTGAFASLLPAQAFTPIAFTGATYADATKKITKTAAFTNYTQNTADRVLITGGTGATVGLYTLATKVDADNITLTTSIGAGADGKTDIAGTLAAANKVVRVKVTGGTGATAGVYLMATRVSDNAIVLQSSIGAGADGQTNIAFTILDNSLMQGIFGCAMKAAAANTQAHIRVVGNCYAFTKNSANAAIAAGNLYGATGAKDLDSDTASYGLNAKLVAKAVDTGTAGATTTRALRLVTMSGIVGWGGTYGGTA